MRKTIKPDLHERDVPSSLESLPRFAVTRSRPNSPDQSTRTDIAFGIRSAEDLIKKVRGGFFDPSIEAQQSKKK